MKRSDPKYMKIYYKEHREKFLARSRLWNKNNQEAKVLYAEAYYERNRKKMLKKVREHYQKHRKDKIVSSQAHRERCKQQWLPFLPKKPHCAICNEPLKYFQTSKTFSVHFDHKKEILPIMGSPTAFLYSRTTTPKNVKTWNECQFGILCNHCNRHLPTKNRIDWLKKALSYSAS